MAAIEKLPRDATMDEIVGAVEALPEHASLPDILVAVVTWNWPEDG